VIDSVTAAQADGGPDPTSLAVGGNPAMRELAAWSEWKSRRTVARPARARMPRRPGASRSQSRRAANTVTVRDGERFAGPLALPGSCPPYVRDQRTSRTRNPRAVVTSP
jgi:hypothetical protein